MTKIITCDLDKNVLIGATLLLPLQQKRQIFTCAWTNCPTGEGSFAYLVSTAERKGQTEVSVKQKPFMHRRADDEMRGPHDQVNVCHVRGAKTTTTKEQSPNDQEKHTMNPPSV